MPRLAKTAYAAIAALVVAGASTGAATLSPAPVSDPPSTAGSGQTAGTSTSTRLAPSQVAASSPRPMVVLFVGDWAALKPRGALAGSFACRAAATRNWQCTVHVSTDRRATWPSSAGLVVLTTSGKDDVAVVTRWLAGLPAGLRDTPAVVVGPVTTATSARAQRQIVALRRFAAGRKLQFVNPVAERWVTPANRARYLSPDGAQLTPAGQVAVGAHLAAALARVEPTR